jgi:lysophospholipase L1-like esterase
MTRLSDPERLAAGLLAALSVVVAATCASTGTLQPATRAPPAESASRSAVSAELRATPPSSVGATVAQQRAAASALPLPEPTARDRLPRFCTALRRLESGAEKRHVRVLWFGDSHTYADYLTGAVRRALQQRFGNGGPGFLHVGLDRYRHAGVKSAVTGSWRQEPTPASRCSRSDDGRFGLGGIRAVAEQGSARASVELLPGAVVGQGRWELAYRLPDARAGFRVQLGAGPASVISGRGGFGPQVQTVRLEGPPAERLRIDRFSGFPQLLGVIVESSEPGVVVDTLGINGARAATPLAWEEAAWGRLVAARRPELVVLAYGTNEVFATSEPELYAQHYEALVARLRRVQSELDCLLVGPTDVAQSDGSTHPRVPAIDAVQRRAAASLGCAYFSVFHAMGGQGSHGRWARQEPPLATGDGVHLTREGYERIGAQIARQWLRACEQP